MIYPNFPFVKSQFSPKTRQSRRSSTSTVSFLPRKFRHLQQDFAELPPSFQMSLRFAGFCERIDPVNHRMDRARGQKAEHVLEFGGTSHRGADHRQVTQIDELEVGLDDGAADRAAHEKAPLRPQGSER